VPLLFLFISPSSQGATALSDSYFTSTHFAGSGLCGECHNGLTDPDGNDVSIETDWSSTLMAQSARDPYWQAKVASELLRNPGFEEEINEACTRCHTPMASVEAEHDGVTLHVFDEGGVLDPDSAYYDAAMDGVSCTLCHQIEDTPELGTLEGFSGNFSIGTYSNPSDRPIFGQYARPRVNPMRNGVQYTPAYAAHISTSELCSTCHNLLTSNIDADGDALEGVFPEQMVYTEWQNSVFDQAGQTCLACHMPQVDGVKIASQPWMLAARNDFALHYLVGGNTVMLDILDQNRELLGVAAENFATSIARTRELLSLAAELEILSSAYADGLLTVTVKVNNRSGHKLPTGYPSRRAYLHLVVRDAQGRIVFESGKLNSNGSVVGIDADQNLAAYEPHYGLITRADQVQVYESVMGDDADKVTYTLLRADGYLKDNRLLPQGFDNRLVPEEVKVVGPAAEDPDFIGGSDTVTYQVPVAASSRFDVRVELNYQPIAYNHAQDLFLDAKRHAAVAQFKTLFESAAIRAETLASVTATVVR
jgi:hypothetical protein